MALSSWWPLGFVTLAKEVQSWGVLEAGSFLSVEKGGVWERLAPGYI